MDVGWTSTVYFAWCTAVLAAGLPTPPLSDPRYLPNGRMMLESGYLDQPYCVIDRHHRNRWVCAITQDALHEGGPGERVVSMYSTDRGKSWSKPNSIEANTTLTNAYSSIAITRFGRIYVMYNFNADNVSALPDGKKLGRSDTLGHFVMKYSDDGGDSWSSHRYEIPYRLTSIDNNNSWKGKVKMMWSVDQSKLANDSTLYYSFTKIGVYPQDAPEEVWFLSSANIMTEQDPSKIEWTLLPNGDHGIPPPGGNPNIAEEGHVMPLPSGGFYAVFRTTQGFLGAASSPIGKHATEWTTPGFAEYWRSTANDRLYLKNPRGPITMKQFSNGRYLLLFYNNGDTGFNSRNPYWLCCGITNKSGDTIMWSQPEIILYDRIQDSRPGYPDFIEEDDGAIYITETQKTIARVHEIDKVMLELLFQQDTIKSVTQRELAAVFNSTEDYTTAPTFPDFGQYKVAQQGFTIDMWVEDHTVSSPGDVMLDSTLPSGQDNKGYTAVHSTDPSCTKRLLTPGLHQLATVVDNGPFVIYFMVDGLVCDGGPTLKSGLQWITNDLGDINGSDKLLTARTYKGLIRIGRVYTRALYTSELVGNFQSGFGN
ncbi:uncharacterized protein LOC134180262 isoform X2 [Corticium candelabrum]|uniref:uncharacterized protein LOC134180262 isoform X2 n=1 Tax=Corticium candelabrum TaxID=121492 RepID=UPI002E267AAE|nr:uncharacterized protein LOC134180262 isoform X2 [Corticium candelabrum]